jgi:hypothetical protein
MTVDIRAHEVQANSHIHHFTPEEARQLFDKMAQFTLDIRGSEFLRRWDVGEYEGKEHESGVATMAGFLLLLPDR